VSPVAVAAQGALLTYLSL